MDLLTRVVAAFEAFAPKVYSDAGGKPTIGFGHLIRDGEHFAETITREAALTLLDADLWTARYAVDSLFRGVYLAPHERDALASFVFNVGPDAVVDSVLRKRVLTGTVALAAHEFLRWVFATRPDGTKTKLPGLIRRRDCESVWFLGAHPDTVARLAGAPPEGE